MRARSFFYVCLGVLAVALAHHFGASTATAQAPANAVVAAVGRGDQSDGIYVFTANGDVYKASGTNPISTSWMWHSNVFSGGPTPVQQESMGQHKVRYR